MPKKTGRPSAADPIGYGASGHAILEAVGQVLATQGPGAVMVAEMNRITYTTTTSAEDQLRARIEYRLAWTASHPGIDSMILYSHIIDPVGQYRGIGPLSGTFRDHWLRGSVGARRGDLGDRPPSGQSFGIDRTARDDSAHHHVVR